MNLKERKQILEEAKLYDLGGARQKALEESSTKSKVFAQLMENQKRASHDEQVAGIMNKNFKELNEAIKEVVKDGVLKESTVVSDVATYNPVLVSMLKRTVVDSVAFEVAGVQPLKLSTGLVFSYVPRYANGTEAFKKEPDTAYTGTGTHSDTNPADLNDAVPGTYTTGTGMATADLESLELGGTKDWAQMKFTVEKTTVEAKGRGVRGEYTQEMVNDLKNAHGLDAGALIADLLSREIVMEQNRQITRSIYITAKAGAQTATTVAGQWSIDDDSKGRWVDENIKSLITQLNRDSASIFGDIRMGRGNFGLTTLNISDALAILPQFKPISTQADGTTCLTGMLNGKKIIVDPYLPAPAGKDVFVSGFKGSTELEAGIFFAPYMGIEFYSGVHTPTFQPTQGCKSRYGLIANPFATATSTAVGDGSLVANTNQFFRRLTIQGSF